MEEIRVIINNKDYNMSNYSSLEDLIDTEFDNKDLSDYTIEEIGGVPSRLYNYLVLPSSLEYSLEEQKDTFDDIFNWANYVDNNPREKEATEAYINYTGSWDDDSFQEAYYGYFDSEEDFASEWLDSVGYEIGDLEDYFDFERYGEEIREEFSDYTPEALASYREDLGLPPLDEEYTSSSRTYGFIGDDEDTEGIEDDSEESLDDEEMERLEQEYQDYVEEHGFEIRLASIEDDYTLGEDFINDVYGGVDNLSRDTLKEYFDLEKFAINLFYDYIFVDGYVFSNY